MTTLLTVQEAKAQINSHLSDADLLTLIGRVEGEITTRFGTSGTTVISEECYGIDHELFVSRPFSSITSVTDYQVLGTGITVTSSEYQAYGRQGRLEKKTGNWGRYTVVQYTPISEDDKRKSVIIDLLKVEIARSPLASERIQREFEYESPDDWEKEREKIFRRLGFLAI